MPPADEPARGEPAVTYVTVRDADDELHLECRFDDGRKFAAVIVEGGFDNLAHRIADFLNAEARASPTAAPSGDGAFEHLADVFEASRRHLPAELAEDFDDAINNCQLALAHRHAPEATVAHDYEPRDCGGTCLVCGCGKVAHA